MNEYETEFCPVIEDFECLCGICPECEIRDFWEERAALKYLSAENIECFIYPEKDRIAA